MSVPRSEPSMPKGRVEAFSDGVFAIVITLLVLEIHMPTLPAPVTEAALTKALLTGLPMVLSFIVSFVMIAIIWVNHHQFWHSLRHATWSMLWLNNLLLLFVVFIPIPTGLIGTYPSLETPALIYGVVMAFTGLSFAAMRYYASYVADLVELGRHERRRAMVRSGLSPILYLIGTSLSLWAPAGALAVYVLVPLIYFFSPRYMFPAR